VRFNIYHKSEYNYNSMVTFSHNLARLKPSSTEFQTLHNYSLEFTPEPYESQEFMDYFGNNNIHFLVRHAHQTFIMIAKSEVELHLEKIKERTQKAQASTLTYEMLRKRFESFHPEDTGIKEYLLTSQFIPLGNKEIMERIYNDFTFDNNFSDISTPIEQVFVHKKGVCQDFAHFAISALRSIGIPARYVSGYIQTLPPEGEEKLFGVDASHAWFSIYIPDVGWVEFDPTNNITPYAQHITLGYGRDYSDIAPLKGVVQSSGVSQLEVMVDVSEVKET
jgi:transglutaminase-like putative cysteine protease